MNLSSSIPASERFRPRPLGSNPLRRAIALAGLLIALAVLATMPCTARAAGVREVHPNLVGGEILGRGFVATFNYERFFTNNFGLGSGLMAFASNGETVGVVPLYASFLAGDVHSLYLGVGAAFVGGGSTHSYESTWVAQYSAGYQFQSPNGFWVRPTFTFNQSNGETLLWPGVAIGGSF